MVKGNGCRNSLQRCKMLVTKMKDMLCSPWPHWTGVEKMELNDRKDI